MVRNLICLSVVFLNVGCGILGQPGLVWPAHIGDIKGFSEDQRETITDALREFNVKSGHTLLDLNGTSGSPITIQWENRISQATGTVVGRALLEHEHCTVQIASLVSDDPSLLIPVIWHELGHCAGLYHVADPGELMYKATVRLESYSLESEGRFFKSVLGNAGML